jgi:hypothetical protein
MKKPEPTVDPRCFLFFVVMKFRFSCVGWRQMIHASRTEKESQQCNAGKQEMASSDNTCTLQTKSRNETTWGVNSAPQLPQKLIATHSRAIVDKIRNPTTEIYCNGIHLLFVPSDLPHRLQCHGNRQLFPQSCGSARQWEHMHWSFTLPSGWRLTTNLPVHLLPSMR